MNAELFKIDPETAAGILELQLLFQNNLDRSLCTRGLDQRGYYQDYKEGHLQRLQQLTQYHPSVNPQQDLLQSDHKQNIHGSWYNIEKGTGRSCTEWIFTLRNIIEQSAEWQRQLHVNFIDSEKAFDSVHRDSLWHILRAYGIPNHMVKLIKSFYNNYNGCVGGSGIWFEVTGVRQGCVMSALLFNLVIDWVMRRTTETGHTGIRWTIFSTLEDLEFAGDLALISHTYQHMQDKMDRLNQHSSQVGLRISQKKSEVMTMNTAIQAPIKVNNNDLPFTESFVYLASLHQMAEVRRTFRTEWIKRWVPLSATSGCPHNTTWASS